MVELPGSTMHLDEAQLKLPTVQRARASSVTRAGSTRLATFGLFSGVGGIELGLRRAGHTSLGVCEVDETARAVLADRFPDVRQYEDVCRVRRLPAETELVVGGFPCQDLSQAGRTAGIEGARSGLVGEVFRLLEATRVPWLVLENVPFMLQLARGRALDMIISRLETLGYQWAYRVVDSRAFGLPQRRRRVIIVASLDHDPRSILFADEEGAPEELAAVRLARGFYWTEGTRGIGWAIDAVPTLKGGSSVGVPSPPAIWLPDGRIVTPDIRDAERMQGFAPGWTRAATTIGRERFRWKLVGNAVSVPVARWVGDRLAKPGAFELRDVQQVKSGRGWPTNAWSENGRRWSSDEMSEWPRNEARKPLEVFLKYPPKLLSERATRGFLKRAESSSLRFSDGFLDAIRAHLGRITT